MTAQDDEDRNVKGQIPTFTRTNLCEAAPPEDLRGKRKVMDWLSRFAKILYYWKPIVGKSAPAPGTKGRFVCRLR